MGHIDFWEGRDLRPAASVNQNSRNQKSLKNDYFPPKSFPKRPDFVGALFPQSYSLSIEYPSCCIVSSIRPLIHA